MLKSLNRGISAPIAIIIIVVCAVLVGGVIVYQYYGIPRGKEETPKETIPEDETADWESYENDKYGFKIKYPLSWCFEDKILSFVYSKYGHNDYGYIKFRPFTYEGEDLSPIWLYVFSNPIKLDYTSYGEKNPSAGSFSSEFSGAIFKEEVILKRDVKATKFTLEEKYTPSKNKYVIITGISKDDLIFELRQELTQEPSKVTPDSIYYKGTNVYNHILSTLEFIEKTEGRDWKILRKKGYGYEIKYYRDWVYEQACSPTVFATFYPEVYTEEYAPAIKISLWIKNEYLEGEEFNPEKRLCLEKCPEEITYHVPNRNKSKTAIIQLAFQEKAWGHTTGWIPLNRELYSLSDSEIEEIFNQVISSFKFIE